MARSVSSSSSSKEERKEEKEEILHQSHQIGDQYAEVLNFFRMSEEENPYLPDNLNDSDYDSESSAHPSDDDGNNALPPIGTVLGNAPALSRHESVERLRHARRQREIFAAGGGELVDINHPLHRVNVDELAHAIANQDSNANIAERANGLGDQAAMNILNAAYGRSNSVDNETDIDVSDNDSD